jgi:hypothetical protein
MCSTCVVKPPFTGDRRCEATRVRRCKISTTSPLLNETDPNKLVALANTLSEPATGVVDPSSHSHRVNGHQKLTHLGHQKLTHPSLTEEPVPIPPPGPFSSSEG